MARWAMFGMDWVRLSSTPADTLPPLCRVVELPNTGDETMTLKLLGQVTFAALLSMLSFLPTATRAETRTAAA